uniref:Transcription factor TFIIB cyclin-like domain-containing protein n=1 Tax=viral metagenome TaxID=1070528 RepID=A0A6C0KFI8_9ZZZZ
MKKFNETKFTKKNKNKQSNKKLWNAFDDEISNKTKIECLYQSTKNHESCELCQSALFYNEEGFLTCCSEKCGIIYTDKLDESAEWRYYGANDNKHSDPTRCGMPINPLLKESSYGCSVSCYSGASYEMRKIRRYTEWFSMPYKEKARYDEFEIIKVMARNSGIPKLIVDSALRYHKDISTEKTFRGLNRDGIIAASIYLACRINNYPRTAKELAAIFHLDNTSATKGCKNAMSILNQIEKDNDDKTHLCKTSPIDFIDRYCSKLNMNNEITKLCQFVAMKIDKNNLVPENTPHSVASGIIYFISDLCHLNISKKDVTKISEISEVTINKCYKKLNQLRTELIPSKILNKYVEAS